MAAKSMDQASDQISGQISVTQCSLDLSWCCVAERGLEFSGHMWKLLAVKRRYSIKPLQVLSVINAFSHRYL